MDITRNMTNSELINLTVDGVKGVNLNKPKRSKNAREKFEIELNNEEAIATTNNLPFARQVAREEFNQAIKSQVDAQLREYGSIEKPEELKLPKVDWDKYSNLKNFKVVKTHERPDTNLSKHNPGLDVKSKVTTYKFKGYGFIYKVMEDEPASIVRAVKKRAMLDKQIAGELK